MPLTRAPEPPIGKCTPQRRSMGQDHAVDRAGAERIAADEEGVKAECDAKLRMQHVAADRGIDAAPSLHADQLGRHPRHVGELPNGTWPSSSNPIRHSLALSAMNRS